MAKRKKKLVSNPYLLTCNDLGTHDLEAVILRSGADHDVKRVKFAQLARQGDPDTLARFLAYRNHLQLTAPPLPDLGYSVAGSFVDVGRYVTGEPECMADFINYQPAQIVTINATLGYPEGSSEQTVFHYFGLMLDAIDRLELSGTRCEVNLTIDFFSPAEHYRQRLQIPFKRADQPLNMAQFAAVMLNAHFFTNILLYAFPSMCRCAPVDRAAGSADIAQTDRLYFPSIWFYKSYEREYFRNTTDYLRAINLGHLLL
ncbi:DUF7192 family protein [Spirosoma sordidisoli]|uniref:DUF7192 domain-containing protein n=1 Tax=Spirosoma sordidisoli TaxID=2502893 RepID=A0A4V1RVD3_9BACT|nr:hypothetical protein [Spirosoma sordidisoli]RYC66368.1 hypothetical protein EQG79_30305 [Spirosoma sordidisoli]